MTDKPTGVFVRLPLSEEQIMKLYNPKQSGNENLLAIGTPVTGADMQACDIVDAAYGDTNEKYVRQSEAQAQLAARDAEIVRLRDAVTKTSAALERVTEERMTSYQAKNGRWVSIQGDDGERCDIIHSDVTTDCEAAIILAHKALKGGAA